MFIRDSSMYYIYSLLVSLFIFALIQYYEMENNRENYRMYTVSNMISLVIIYLITTIVFYTMLEVDYKYANKIPKKSLHGGDSQFNVEFLKKIPDDISTGFRPSTN